MLILQVAAKTKVLREKRKKKKKRKEGGREGRRQDKTKQNFLEGMKATYRYTNS